VRVDRAATGTADAGLHGRVVVDEYLGADRCLHVDGPAGRLVVRVPPDGPSALGSELVLRIDPARIQIYAPKPGEPEPAKDRVEVAGSPSRTDS
jgi:hypothetical protein